jgi:hypothetical protein
MGRGQVLDGEAAVPGEIDIAGDDDVPNLPATFDEDRKRDHGGGL